jgi:hypothetical protein
MAVETQTQAYSQLPLLSVLEIRPVETAAAAALIAAAAAAAASVRRPSGQS